MVSSVIASQPRISPRERAVWDALADVADPEIPAVSVVDLGVIRGVAFEPTATGERLTVELMPTFVGCPAIDAMQHAIAERVAAYADDVRVVVTFEEPWTSDRITPAGRRKLRESGFAPPATPASAAQAAPRAAPPSVYGGLTLLDVLPSPAQSLPIAECPYCGSRDTTLDNAFGPTLCRAIYYCRGCRQPFEQFKSV